MSDVIDKVKRYYNDNQIFYRVFWMNKNNLAMHYGYWLSNTKKKHEALLNENAAVAKALDIQSGDYVLDAGCGVGGSSFWIATKYNAKVMGITIVEKQVELANKYARDRKLKGEVDFKVADFCDTGFPDNTFDKIFAIESSCHADSKHTFLKEMYRILKPGGRICIADYFLNHKPSSKRDRFIYDTVCSGWALPDLSSTVQFSDIMKARGFINIVFDDHTKEIMKSAKSMSVVANIWRPIDETMHFFKMISDENLISTKASMYQHELFTSGLAVHGIFEASKPTK